jgi:uncharacterized membrane protein
LLPCLAAAYDRDPADLPKKSLQHLCKISNIHFVKKIKDFFKKYFITGLLVIIPIWATYYVLSALLSVIDGMLGDLPRYFLGLKFPGLGIITLIFFILIVGMLSANYLGTRLVRYSDHWMQRVPLVRGVYTTIKQIMETFSIKHNFRGVALVEYPRKGCYSVGFMTGEVQGASVGLTGKFITVFVPTTPNPTAGFLLILPEAEVTQLDMTVEQGMKFIISLGLVPMHEVDARRLKHPTQEIGK